MLSRKQILLSGIAVVVIIAGAVLTKILTSYASGPNPALYQAVFLDNDRAYFGHLKRADSQFFVLDDVYYVEATPAIPGQKTPPTNRLIRLGAIESHGPENTMMIEEGHIRIWENLRPNSPLVQAIINLKLQTR